MLVTSLLGYDIIVERGTIDRVGEIARRTAPAHRYAIITDRTVAPLYADRVLRSLGDPATLLLTVNAGESSKTRETWMHLTDELLAAGCGRDTTIVALGGGMVGDLAGFVAATFMRGIPFVQVPTTLLAMIDAAIGGKTGVDTPTGKNLVGAFHRPAAVIVDPNTLATLPLRELRAGFAEALKHGAIADAAYFDRTAEVIPALLHDPCAPAMEALITRSIEIKADVVRRDEREGGFRKILNFGHTIGHAIEAESGYRLLHGEAIAIGLALEAMLAERIGVAEPGTADGIQAAVARAGLPSTRPADLDPERILHATRSDKKSREGVVEYALPRRIGAMAGEASAWGVRVGDADVRAILA
jgi:3-dehydroquinate synthase